MDNNKKLPLLFEGSEWDFKTLEKTWKAIDHIGKVDMGLDYYDAQIEVISSEQMLDNYSSSAMPLMYNHWSFGKSFIRDAKSYQDGSSGLAYEVVINTNPSIAYLMENNTMTMQALVLAHASVGHSSFFKTNYLFKEWSDADSILDYLKYARNYIARCEEKYGVENVEHLLDCCHSLQNHGVDKYKKPHVKKGEKIKRQEAVQKHEEEDFNDLWRSLPPKELKWEYDEGGQEDSRFPEENLLYFIEKNSPVLLDWKKR